MSVTAPVFKHLRNEVLRPVEFELIGRNRPGNFSSMRSCGSSRSLDSYHMSVPQLRQCGSAHPYSLRQNRDRSVIGTPLEQYADGLDIAFPAKKLQAFSKALIELVQANPPYAHDVREIIYSPDGKTVLRWDAARGMSSNPRAGEADNSHLWHTHISQYRDAAERVPGTSELVIRGLEAGGLITTEDMDGYLEPFKPEEPVTKDEVKALQATINECGYEPPLLVDGIYGPMTHSAVLALPQLMKDRVAGAALIAAMNTKTTTKEAAVAAVEAL